MLTIALKNQASIFSTEMMQLYQAIKSNSGSYGCEHFAGLSTKNLGRDSQYYSVQIWSVVLAQQGEGGGGHMQNRSQCRQREGRNLPLLKTPKPYSAQIGNKEYKQRNWIEQLQRRLRTLCMYACRGLAKKWVWQKWEGESKWNLLHSMHTAAGWKC